MHKRDTKAMGKVLSVAEGEEVWTIRDLANYLRCHTSTVYRLVKKGDIPHFRIGSDIRFRRVAIKNWLDKQSGGT